MDHMLWRISPGLSLLLPVVLLGFAATASAQTAENDPAASPRERTALAASFASERLAVWQQRLNLQDWSVSIVVSRTAELKPKTLGNIHWDLPRKTAVIRVLDPADYRLPFPEVLEDMNRAVRFIRFSAERFHIDPNRIGITGGSAGGHLSLMIGLAGEPGNPDAKKPIMRFSSRVQAVACFFPPTDFLNYGQPCRDVFRAIREELSPFQAPFDFHEFDEKAKKFVPI